MFTAQKAVPLMTSGGAVVLIGSIAGSIGTPGVKRLRTLTLLTKPLMR